MEREPNTQYVLTFSYGKDSTACLRAIELLGWPLDRIVTADIWATETIPADLPEVWEFKKVADQKIYDMYGIHVEHYHALVRNGGGATQKQTKKKTFEYIFYKKRESGKRIGDIHGWPLSLGSWCNDRLKISAIDEINRSFNLKAVDKNAKQNIKTIRYIGIAADEYIRIERHKNRSDVKMPLVEIGWDEDLCGLESKYMDLLSPTYENSFRDGCWFCPKQGIDQLRRVWNVSPDLWEMMLKWDSDSPVAFHPDGYTVHDFDRRFKAERAGLVPMDRKFRWKMLDSLECNE